MALLSLGAHIFAWSWLTQLLPVDAGATERPEPVPVTLLSVESSSPAPLPAAVPQPPPPPAKQESPSPPGSPDDALKSTPSPQAVSPPPTLPPPQTDAGFPPAANVPSSALPSPESISPPTEATSPASAPGTDPAPVEFVAPTPPPQGQQLVLLNIQKSDAGYDLPEQPPQLLNRAPLGLADWQGRCAGFAQVARFPGVTVQMRLDVDAAGRIRSAVPVPDQGTGDVVADGFIACVLQNGLTLGPASSGGVPHRTDAAILQLRL